MTEQLMTMFGQFGAPGAMLMFMVWDRTEQRKLADKRTAADIQMAQAITLLTAKLDHAR